MSYFFDIIESPFRALGVIVAFGVLLLAWQASLRRYERRLAERVTVPVREQPRPHMESSDAPEDAAKLAKWRLAHKTVSAFAALLVLGALVFGGSLAARPWTAVFIMGGGGLAIGRLIYLQSDRLPSAWELVAAAVPASLGAAIGGDIVGLSTPALFFTAVAVAALVFAAWLYVAALRAKYHGAAPQ